MLHEEQTTDIISASRQLTRIAQPYLAVSTIILLLAYCLRLYRLDAQALRGDEAFSIVNWSTPSLSFLLTTIGRIDPQPPFTLLLFNLWMRAVGTSEFATRMISVLVSMLFISATIGVGRSLLDKRLGHLLGLLAATSPYALWHAQDFRQYSLWMCLSTISIFFLHRLLRGSRHVTTVPFYITASTLALYTFYLELFMLACHGLVALVSIRSKIKIFHKWLMTQLPVIVLVGPWYALAATWRDDYNPTAGNPTTDFLAAYRTLLLGETLPNPHTFPLLLLQTVLILALLLLPLATLTSHKISYPDKAFVLLPTIVPLALLGLLTLLSGQGYFWERYASASLAPLLAVLGIALHSLSNEDVFRRFLAYSLLLIIISLNMLSMWHYHFNPDFAKAPDWRKLMSVLNVQPTPNDLILRNYPDPAFDYYYDGQAPQIILPTRRLEDPAITHRYLTQYTEDSTYIWYTPVTVYWDDPKVVRSWIRDNTQYITEDWVGGFHLFQYATWDVELNDIAKRLPYANYGDFVLLHGYRIANIDTQLSAGDTLVLELFWEPLKPTATPMTVFVHLSVDTSPSVPTLWAQDDHPPQNGRISTTNWSSLFRDVYYITIPDNAPHGRYVLTTGLYDPETGNRIDLVLPNGQSTNTDQVTVTTINILPTEP